MKTRNLRGAQGQGLAEYALIVALVALVVGVSAFSIGFVTERVFGVVAGVLGAKHNSSGAHVIEITSATCIGQQSPAMTGLVVFGITDSGLDQLQVSTDVAITGLTSTSLPISSTDIPNGFLINPIVSSTLDMAACPHSIVIQTADGSTAVSPVATRIRP
jgi:hypothetical protein